MMATKTHFCATNSMVVSCHAFTIFPVISHTNDNNDISCISEYDDDCITCLAGDAIATASAAAAAAAAVASEFIWNKPNK